MFDYEAEAEALLTKNGFPIDEAPDVEYLACCELGFANVVTAYGLQVPARARNGVIQVNPRASARRKRWLIVHELSEIRLQQALYMRADVEIVADRLAAAILVPRRALLAAVRIYGRHLPTLAAVFETTQTIISLRLGEVTGSSVALVTRRTVMFRGPEYVWPGLRGLRGMAHGANDLPPGIERLLLTDSVRVALVALG
jgi:hypothetical protein